MQLNPRSRHDPTGFVDAESQKPRILVADDERTNRSILIALLQAEGYQVVSADNGKEAVELFQRNQPDLVLMDVMMPEMDGYEATRRIKKIAGERFVPVIFITALDDEGSLVKGIEAGGDDFLSKPYNRTVLKAKIDALMRVRALYWTQLAQKKQLAHHQKRIEQEQRVAERMFASIVHTGCLNDPAIRYSISPMAIFNGDLLLASKTPSGLLHVMLGDFTGHGLAASIGALPASEIFYGMTAKGFGIGDIAAEVNKRLKTILPTGLFLAVTLLALNHARGSVTVWNGGLPDALLYDRESGLKQRFESQHLPLGILNADLFDPGVELCKMAEDERLFLYTDGVIEAQNSRGEFFGQARLEAHLQGVSDPNCFVDEVQKQLEVFQEGEEQGDDITMIQIACRPPKCNLEGSGAEVRHASKPAAAWRVAFDMSVDVLRTLNPLPMLVQALMEIQGLYNHREHLYVVLTELFTNALEHGLLGLDSTMKQTSDGFMAFYNAREKRLAELKEGKIRIEFTHTPTAQGGRLVIKLDDSGPGFDVTHSQSALKNNVGYSGRGINLVRTLCKEIVYNDRGNGVQVVYDWAS